MNGIRIAITDEKQPMRPVKISHIHGYGIKDVHITIEVPASHRRFKELNEKLDFIQNMTRDQMLDAILDYNPDNYVSVKKEEVHEDTEDTVFNNGLITW